MRATEPGSATGSGPTGKPGDPLQDTGPRGAAPGVRETLERLAATAASALDTRIELATLEFTEERARARDRLVLTLTAAIAAAFALLAANTLLVAVLWDRLGWITLAVLTVAWGLLALLAVRRMRCLARREKRPFDATLAGLARDRDWIVERMGRRPR